MGATLTALLVSGGVTVALVTLLRYERTRGLRFFQNIRASIDHTLEETKQRMWLRYRWVTGQAIRQSIQYMFHQILTFLLRCIHRLEDFMHAIVRVNKNRANRPKNAVSTGHFAIIADHKRSTQLSDVEKQQRRDHALSGR